MSNHIDVKFEGVDEAMEVLKAYPINAHKVVDKAIRKAGRDAVKEVKKAVPHSQWKKIAKGRLKSNKEGDSAYFFGLFKDKLQDSKKMPDWNKAYWLNYGTLANRDRTHRFAYARRPESAHWKGGIKPRRYIDLPLEIGLEKMRFRFVKELDKATNEILNAHATAKSKTTEIR